MDWKTIRKTLNRSADKYKFYFGNYSYVDPTKSSVGRKVPKPHQEFQAD